MKVKAHVKEASLASLSKARKCLEIGRDLCRVQMKLHELWVGMAQKKYGTIRAHVAAVEVERMTERFPLTKKKLAPVEKSLRRIASGSLGGEAAKKALWEVRGVFSSLVKDAERTCS